MKGKTTTKKMTKDKQVHKSRKIDNSTRDLSESVGSKATARKKKRKKDRLKKKGIKIMNFKYYKQNLERTHLADVIRDTADAIPSQIPNKHSQKKQQQREKKIVEKSHEQKQGNKHFSDMSQFTNAVRKRFDLRRSPVPIITQTS